MKKLLVLFACLGICFSSLVAQDDPFERDRFEAEKTSVKVIDYGNKYCTDKNASVKIEYTYVYDEIRIYYETLYVTYDRGEAMNTIMAVLQDFQKEYKYNSYVYLKPEVQKYFKDDRGQRKAQWSAYLKFKRVGFDIDRTPRE